jgi:hypothetical protein
MMTIYVAIGYVDHYGNKSNVGFLRKEDAQGCVDDGNAVAVAKVESEELMWMKNAADAACEFNERTMMGSIELSVLYDGIQDYEQEVWHR